MRHLQTNVLQERRKPVDKGLMLRRRNILNFTGLEGHIRTNGQRSAIKGIHPFHQTLNGIMTILGPWITCCSKSCSTVNHNEDSVGFTSDIDIGVVNEKQCHQNLQPAGLTPCYAAHVALSSHSVQIVVFVFVCVGCCIRPAVVGLIFSFSNSVNDVCV